MFAQLPLGRQQPWALPPHVEPAPSGVPPRALQQPDSTPPSQLPSDRQQASNDVQLPVLITPSNCAQHGASSCVQASSVTQHPP